MSPLPKTIYRFNAIPIKISMAYFTDNEQIFQKFIWNPKRPRIASATLRKKDKVGGTTIPGITLHHKAAVLNGVWHRQKNRHTGHRKRMGSPETHPCLYGQLIFKRGAHAYNGAKAVSSVNGVERTGLVHAKK